MVSDASRKTAGVRGNFGEGSVYSLIVQQALPLTLAQLVQLLYNIVDRVYIGHMPGENSGLALTGLGLCFPVITLISAVVNFVSTGSAPLCSMARGHKDPVKAKDILTTAFCMELLLGLAVALLAYFFRRPLLFLLGASSATYGFADSYLSIYLLGTLFFAIGTGMNTFINLQGFPRMGMLTTVIGAVINLILDPIFIFVLGLGVRGAAIATVISQFCSAVWVFRFLTRPEREIRLDIRKLRISTYVLKETVPLGIPGFIMGATNCAVQAVCNSTLSIYGGDVYIGIMTIINSVREISGLAVNGITNGAQPVLSYNYGAELYERVKKGIRFTALAGLIYTALFWTLTLTLPDMLIRIFSSDAETLELGVTPLKIYFMGFIFMSLQFAGQSTFVALGKAKQAVFFSIFRKIIIVVPLTLLLPKLAGLGVLGVFWAEPISNVIGGSASFICMYLTVYRKLPSQKG